jgi:hypothetical protein
MPSVGNANPSMTVSTPSSCWSRLTTGMLPPSRLKDGVNAPDGFQRGKRFSHRFGFAVGDGGIAVGEFADFPRDGVRRIRFHVRVETRANVVAALIRNEAHRDLRHRFRRQHGLRSRAREAADNAVDVERGPCADAFNGGVTFLAPKRGRSRSTRDDRNPGVAVWRCRRVRRQTKAGPCRKTPAT